MKKLLWIIICILTLWTYAQAYTQQQVSSALDFALNRFDNSTQLLKLNNALPKIGKIQLSNPPKQTWDLLKMLENAIREKITLILSQKFEISQRSLNTQEKDLFNEMNTYRNNQWLSPLILNTQLSQAAIILAEDMARLDYFTHVSPEWVWYIQRLELVWYEFDYVSENLGQWNTEAEVIVSLRSESPVHKVNLYSTKADEVGVAYTKDHYWVAVYASPQN